MKMKKALNILKQMPFWFFISLRIILLAVIGIICIAKFFEKADIIFAFSRETLDLLFKHTGLYVGFIIWLLEIILSFQLRKNHLFFATLLAGYYIIYSAFYDLYHVYHIF